MDRREQEALYRRIGIGAGRVHGDPAALAVLVVDFQRLFTEGPLASEETPHALARTGELLRHARAAELPVFHSRVVYESAEEAGPVWSVKSPTMLTCLRGAAAVEFDDAVAPVDGEVVVDKRRASAFFGTALDEDLRQLGVSTLLVAGTSTSGCVRASVLDGFSLDYRMLVVRDCVDDRARLSGEMALFDIDAKYGDVVSLDDALSLVGKARDVAPGRLEDAWK